eukprot:4376291-Prymnesium_polylepis.1
MSFFSSSSRSMTIGTSGSYPTSVARDVAARRLPVVYQSHASKANRLRVAYGLWCAVRRYSDAT